MVTGPSAFQILISEQGLYSLGGIDVYSYGDYTVTDLSQYKTLSIKCFFIISSSSVIAVRLNLSL